MRSRREPETQGLFTILKKIVSTTPKTNREIAKRSTNLTSTPTQQVHDASPFRFSERDPAARHFGRLLEAGGYNYYGTERLYSGVDGRELSADIFCGLVHYQRLRHMVSDKWQVRTTGAVDALTRQPVKGRRRGGGVRLGEMERDALISHGAAFLLQDRLFHCSDKSEVPTTYFQCFLAFSSYGKNAWFCYFSNSLYDIFVIFKVKSL